MKLIGATLQRTYLTKNCKKKHCDIQLNSLTFLVLHTVFQTIVETDSS